MSDIREELPPERLLDEESHFRVVKAGIACIDDIDTLQAYVAYENANQERIPIIRLFARRAKEIREAEG